MGRAAIKDDKIYVGLILSCEEDYAHCFPFLEKGNFIFSYIKFIFFIKIYKVMLNLSISYIYVGAAVYSPELLLNGIAT